MPSSNESVDLTTQDEALWRSLYVLSTMPSAVNEDTVSGVPAANNPRPLRGMGDHAEYWVNNSGEAFVFKFPATVDLDAQFDRTGPYYNLPRTGLDLDALRKMRAQFEIRLLDINAQGTLPEEAIRCSLSALDLLNVLHGEAEEARNALLPRAMYPCDNPFWRWYPQGEDEQFSVVVTTNPLIGNIPDNGHSNVPRLKRGDIGKGDSMQSPSKAKAAAMAGGAPNGGEPSAGGGTDPEHPPLSELPDPLGCYAALITKHRLRDARVIAPNIRDGAGMIIRPQEYRTKLKTGDVVFIECLLKLWTIPPSRRQTNREEDRTGSRRYQVMLRSMKLLPDVSITEDTLANHRSDVKGKRKARDDGKGSSVGKKR